MLNRWSAYRVAAQATADAPLLQKRFWTLDLLRLFAAGSVMVFHLSWWSWVTPRSTPASVMQGATEYPAWTPYAWFGWVGVEIFFVISGFVIFMTADGSSPASFVRRRYLRLFPAALVCATITAAVALAIDLWPMGDLIMRWVRSAFFWPYGPWIDGVYWTLGVEVAFYLVVALAIRAQRFMAIETVIIAVGCASSAAWLVNLALNGRLTGDLAPLVSSRTETVLLLRHGVLFALGALIWAGSHRGWTAKRLGFAALFSFVGALTILRGAQIKVSGFDLDHSEYVPIAVWAVAVALIALSARYERPIPTSAQAASSVIGRSTYPLYLLHDIVGVALLVMLLNIGFAPGMALVTAMCGMLALAVIVCVYVEDRIRPQLDPRNWKISKRATDPG
ncbi:acyltransferase [Synechococcus phage Yong-M2-251]|nr:acyltransferase [Synechococcus phage Yong-M2-251]